jgi:hypothetical protein
MEFCPVCMLRKGLADAVKSDESSVSEDTVEPATLKEPARRFEHFELVTGEDGKPVELGRGAMGVTYKAFDVDLHCPVTLKVISERYLGDESARLRFLREARAAASQKSPRQANRIGSVCIAKACQVRVQVIDIVIYRNLASSELIQECWRVHICDLGSTTQ